MQPPSKSKTWANEDPIKDNLGGVSLHSTVVPSGEGVQSDNEYEPVPKKQKKTNKSRQTEAVLPPTEPNVISEQEPSDPDPVAEESSILPGQVDTATSDADWLRSRTSRLLGLVDDEETEVSVTTSKEGNCKEGNWQKTGDSGVPFQKEQTPTSEANVQTDEEPIQETPTSTNVTTLKAPEDSSGTGRLFIRNLPYSVAEDELRAHFAPYGDLGEVSLLFSHDRYGKSLCYDLVMNILIGTAYAMHVMLPGRVF